MTRRLLNACRRGPWPWKRHGEAGSPSRPTLHRDGPAVRLRHPFRDGEPKAGAGPLALAGTGRVGAPEAVEYMRQVARRNADAGVDHGQLHGADRKSTRLNSTH